MSSPGNAAWCIAVRMSPGSTAYARMPGSSAASVSVEVVEGGLRGAVAAPRLVVLDRRVGRDVDDDPAGGLEGRQQRAGQRVRGERR